MNRKKYLQKLEDEHEETRRLLGKIDGLIGKADISEDEEKKLWEKFGRLKGILIAHVHSEDNVFYKDLREMAVTKGQDALLPALDFYMKSMHRISEDAEEFFRKYNGGKLKDTENFVRRFRKLKEELLERITSEEGSLFYIYRAYFFEE